MIPRRRREFEYAEAEMVRIEFEKGPIAYVPSPYLSSEMYSWILLHSLDAPPDTKLSRKRPWKSGVTPYRQKRL